MSVKVWLKANQAPIFLNGEDTEFKLIDDGVLEIKRDGDVTALFGPGVWGWVIELEDE